MPTSSSGADGVGSRDAPDLRGRRVAFAVGTGRCGTHLLHELLAAEPSVSSHHELNPPNEAFHRYCRWNELPVDDRGFLDIKAREIALASPPDGLFFEASSYLSLSVKQLHRRFAARFVLMVRDPLETVLSLRAKGWYEVEYRKDEPGRPVGFHDLGNFVHFLSRLVPNGPEFERWSSLPRAARLAWFWAALNERALADLRSLPDDAWMVVRLEDLDLAKYAEIARFLGIVPTLTPDGFRAIAGRRPGASWPRPGPMDLPDAEFAQVALEVAATAGRLGYPPPSAPPRRDAMPSDPGPAPAVVGRLRKAGSATGALPPGSVLLSIDGSAPELEEIVLRGLDRGIRGYHVRIDADGGRRRLETLVALRMGHSPLVLVELAGPGDPGAEPDDDVLALIREAADLVAIEASRPADFLKAQQAAGHSGLPAVASVRSWTGLLHWRDLLRASCGVIVWRTELRRAIDEADLDHWILAHQEDALKQNKIFCVAIGPPSDSDPEAVRAAERMAGAGLSILVPSDGGPAAWGRWPTPGGGLGSPR
ncbi:hypothetical protein OJF2_08730 [Aquisphaera giovannonii]|uniref:Sulfotransferase domain protein n=1 Tax=Aquisphaera giovannonii TaxID=406548 RepID=A0A5B9VVN2_9BACT|nr:sulfotransferase [Aquisphaera giovannonii]QEH32403.1 hypothetical protein OJF2_08730 [Aquisphaera giovannonii]